MRNDGTVFQRVINPTDTPIVIPKNSVIGRFHCASAKDTFVPFGLCSDNEETVNVANLNKPQVATADALPAPVVGSAPLAQPTSLRTVKPSDSFIPSRELDLSDSNLTTAQKGQLSKLVDEYRDIFLGPNDHLWSGWSLRDLALLRV